MGIMNYESKLLLLWKLGKGWPQRSWWGEKTISGWWKWFSFTPKDLHPLPITFCLKLNDKGPQRFLRQQETIAQIQKDWNFLLFYQHYEDIFMKLPSNIGMVVWKEWMCWCTGRKQRTVPRAPHHNTASLSGVVPPCAASFHGTAWRISSPHSPELAHSKICWRHLKLSPSFIAPLRVVNIKTWSQAACECRGGLT